MPPVSTRISRLAGASWRSILYCRPEQPPPTTATRKTPCGRPCRVSSELTFLAALAVTLIRRSSPMRKPAGEFGLLAEAAIIRPSFQPASKLPAAPRQVNAGLRGGRRAPRLFRDRLVVL